MTTFRSAPPARRQEAGGRRRASGGGSRGTAACGNHARVRSRIRETRLAGPKAHRRVSGGHIRAARSAASGQGAHRHSPWALAVSSGGPQDHRHPGRRGTRDLGASGRQAKREVASQPLDHSCQPDTRTLSVTGGTRPICAAATAPGDQLLTALSAELTCPRPVARPSVTPNRDLVPAGPADSLSARLSAPR